MLLAAKRRVSKTIKQHAFSVLSIACLFPHGVALLFHSVHVCGIAMLFSAWKEEESSFPLLPCRGVSSSCVSLLIELS